ncbi:ty3-gypsy retrotransposon protein [Cucumis melo var. makuwa]|uniref:Ty3-gypsy retrotransposon protein n=1 Tax=Cucumis melo var. makuwa TaxID=1194695 RepID=A0A5D3CBQ9_CUCMM|nr:ty3-gypsy retrotransposon protein [Cucumis melo var. makuwa]
MDYFGIRELTLKFSGFAVGLFGDSSLYSVDSLGVDSIKGHSQVSSKGFLTTGPRIEAGNVVTHMGIIRNVTVSCSLCAIMCNELLTDRHRCPDVLCIVVILVGYVVSWNCMSMDYKVLMLGCGVTVSFIYGVVYLTDILICVSFGVTRLIRTSFEITGLMCAFYGTTRLLCRVRVQRGADRRGARRMREDHMDASGFLYASADVFCYLLFSLSDRVMLPSLPSANHCRRAFVAGQPEPIATLPTVHQKAVQAVVLHRPRCLGSVTFRLELVELISREIDIDIVPADLLYGIPLGITKDQLVPTRAQIARVRRRASSEAEAKVRTRASWRVTRSDRGRFTFNKTLAAATHLCCTTLVFAISLPSIVSHSEGHAFRRRFVSSFIPPSQVPTFVRSFFIFSIFLCFAVTIRSPINCSPRSPTKSPNAQAVLYVRVASKPPLL